MSKKIPITQIQELRSVTMAGMGDCKQALETCDGDMEQAKEWLRKKGITKGEKKTDRVSSDGVIVIAHKEKDGMVMEINSETDFVARNAQFHEFCYAMAPIILEANVNNLQDALSIVTPCGLTVAQKFAEISGFIGENLVLRNIQRVKEGIVCAYGHGAFSTHTHQGTHMTLCKIGVIVSMDAPENNAVRDLGKKICMQIAANRPLCIAEQDMDPALVEKERIFLLEQVSAEGKPAAVAEKMVSGRMEKFFKGTVLLNQEFILDPAQTVQNVLASLEKEIGQAVHIKDMVRYMVGQ